MTGSKPDLRDISGLLLDIDGVLTVSWRALPAAPEALARLSSSGIPFALLTNTTELTRADVVDRLRNAGFRVRREDVMTAPALTAAYLRSSHPGARCLVLSAVDLTEDLEGIELVEDQADVVVIGGATEPFGAEEANRAFRMLLDGAALVLMHRSPSWMTDQGMTLDAGVMLAAGLEEATGREAVVCGKPSPECFRASLSLLGLPTERAAMVGDDLRNDVLAAQSVGLTGVLVRTGKFRETDLESASRVPDFVIDSVADLPELLRPA